MYFPKRNELTIGDTVTIRLQGSSTKFGTGKIESVLTTAPYHPQGILVRLESGLIGRVQPKPKFDKNEVMSDYRTVWEAINNRKKPISIEERRKTTPNLQKPWTEQVDLELVRKFTKNPEQNKDTNWLISFIRETAGELGRTEDSTKSRLRYLGCISESGKISPLISNPSIQFQFKDLEDSNVDVYIKQNDYTYREFPVEKLPSGEDDHNEFKSSHHTPTGNMNKFEKMEEQKKSSIVRSLKKEVAITISALANKKGGRLFIGVNDDGEPIGLDRDLEKFDGNFDRYQRHVMDSLQKFLPDSKAFISSISWTPGKNKKFLVAEVGTGLKPVFITDGNKKEMYVRNGPESELYNDPEAVHDYLKYRFPDS